jgi:hypothetical protein
MSKPDIKIEMKVTETDTDPKINVITITVRNESGIYPETFGSGDEASAYLKALRNLAIMLGRRDIEIPDLPKEMKEGYF